MKNKNFFESLSYALKGIKEVIKTERNFKIDLVMLVAVVVCSFIFPLLKWERCFVRSAFLPNAQILQSKAWWT